ncbi:MAG TPA: thiamine pyrophosphate-dependent enzyme [Nitrospiria bacterium]|jgi:phosphonopyruvate decarboxylase/sulfopyruvate decarboxylase subunit beta
MLTRTQALLTISENLTSQLVIHCNGYIGRESFTLKDRRENFYMIGSMGLASSIGFGLALSNPRKKVIVLDGDGNVLMNLGALSTIGVFQPQNLTHIVLDNGVYGSTGNQPTLSSKIDLAKMAMAAGYRWMSKPNTIEELVQAFEKSQSTPGPCLIHILIPPTTDETGIGRVTYTPEEMTRRLRSVVAGH